MSKLTTSTIPFAVADVLLLPAAKLHNDTSKIMNYSKYRSRQYKKIKCLITCSTNKMFLYHAMYFKIFGQMLYTNDKNSKHFTFKIMRYHQTSKIMKINNITKVYYN